jgi:hypothetical protein
LAAGLPEPRHADPVAAPETGDAGSHLGDMAHDFVPGYHRGAVHRKLTGGDVQVGAADTAGVHRYQQLAGAGLRIGHLHAAQCACDVRTRCLNLPRLHAGTPLPSNLPSTCHRILTAAGHCDDVPQNTAGRRRAPRWARWCLIVGSVLLVAAGGTVAASRVVLATATRSITGRTCSARSRPARCVSTRR